MIYQMYENVLGAVVGHAGFKTLKVNGKTVANMGDFHHQLHHRYFDCNYGVVFMPFDKWFDSYHDGTPESLQRLRRKQKKMSNFDVIVVGGGPGGYVAAIRSAQLGLSTAVVEKQHMGGICLNWGCIPTKALLAGADVAHKIATASDYGINVGGVTIDIDKLVGHSRSVSGRLSGGVSSLMSKNKITVINGEAKLADKGVLEVGGEDAGTYKAPHIILATGARPRAIPGLEPDGEAIWTYFEALVPKSVPATMLVIGSGAIGTEFASLYADLGTQVTLVEMVDKIVPAEDPEISDHLQRQFKQRGIEVHTGTTVENAARTDGGVRCELVAGDSRDAREFEKVIVAAGVVPNVEGLGLEALGAEFDRGFIKTDQWSRTNVAGLYAIGDVAGPPCLAHKASHEGTACVEGLAGVADAHPVDLSQVPGCTYSRPADRECRHDGTSSQSGRAECFGWPVFAACQRQGSRHRRRRGPGQDDLRSGQWRTTGCPYDRARSDRADSGIRHRTGP